MQDEPTSGLDASSASEIMALLRRLASDTGVTIVTSVHQPSSRVFHTFDQVTVFDYSVRGIPGFCSCVCVSSE